MHFVSLLIGQFLIGVIIGFIINIIFLAFQAAGEIIDMQMGLSVAQALDPVFGAVISIIGRLTFNVALIIFLVVNGHHMILSALHQSFTIVPVGALPNLLNPSITGQVIDLGRMLWLTAFQLAGPAILMIFLLDFSFGIVSRVAPQVNVFMLGFQIKPSLGLIAILFTLPFWVKIISKTMETMGGEVIRVLMAIKP
jgi:flagellar biosynthesis protein FliR